MEYTENYKLAKPEGVLKFDPDYDNGNYDIIDTALKANADAALKAQKTADSAIPSSQKGSANGVSTLDENGKIPINQMPESTISNIVSITENEYESLGTYDAATLYVITADIVESAEAAEIESEEI